VPDKFEPGIINPRLVRLSLDSEAIDPYFFVHFFKSPFAQLQMQMESHGGTMGILNAKNISELAVPVPPLPEQRRIAAILDKADAIRPKRQETIRLTEDLLRSAFLDMFGDPVTNPKGWPVQQLGDHLKFVTSGSRGWAKYYAPSGSRFVRSLDVQMNRISDEDVVYVQPPDSAESARTKVEAGDVLLTITGSRIGRVAPVPKDLGAAHISQHVAILRLGPGLLPGFLSLFMSLPSGGQRQIQQMQYGQTKPGLNLQQARAFQVPCPPLELQRRFMKVWEVLNGLKKHIGLTHCSEADLRGSLVKRAFRGGL